MTSWLQTGRMRKEDGESKPRPYFLSLENGEFSSHFNSFFYAQAYAQSNNRELFVYDQSTVMPTSYALLQETFAPLPGLTYTSEMKAMVSVLRPRDFARFGPFLSAMSVQELRTQARRILVWNPIMLAKILLVGETNNLPEAGSHDVGVHIRSITRATVLQTYVDAIQTLSTKLGKTDLAVFVMADEPAQLEEFKRLAPKTWSLSTIRHSNTSIRGNSVASFGRQNANTKITAYLEYITALYYMQNCSNIIYNLSNDTGRFLYLTAKAITFKSLDIPTWAPF